MKQFNYWRGVPIDISTTIWVIYSFAIILDWFGKYCDVINFLNGILNIFSDDVVFIKIIIRNNIKNKFIDIFEKFNT